MMSTTETTMVLTIPKPWQHIAFAWGVTAFVLFFVLVAIGDLLIGVAWIPSLLWLGFVCFQIYGIYKDEGLRGTIVGFLSCFSGSHFADTTNDEAWEKEVRFGFRLLGHRFCCQKIAIQRIETVEWSPGQATGMTGRDVDDWSVKVWFDHGDRDRSERRKYARKPDQDIYIVGPSRSKGLTFAFGRELLSFLIHAGAVLEQGDNDHTFVRKSIDSTQ
jgi:hypothetical protein